MGMDSERLERSLMPHALCGDQGVFVVSILQIGERVMSDQWEHRVIKVNLAAMSNNAPVAEPVIMFDSLLGGSGMPTPVGSPRQVLLSAYLNDANANGGNALADLTWEICGVIPMGAIAHILLKRRKQ
jgi:hypothetical protein